MAEKLACVALVALSLAAGVGISGPATAAEPASPQSAARDAAPSGAQVAPGKWDVDHVHCADLLAASDDDRASAVMFYYGYLAAKQNIHVIDVGKISDNIEKVMKECEAAPKTTVPQAFRQALGPRK